MKTLTKTSRFDKKILDQKSTASTKKRSEKQIANSIINLFKKQLNNQPEFLFKKSSMHVNKFWMRDFMKQAKFLKTNTKDLLLTANCMDDFCYYDKVLDQSFTN